MELVPYSDDDLYLTEALEGEEAVMREPGGALSASEISAAHQRRLDTTARGDWWLKIVPEHAGPAVGTIGIWETDWRDSKIHEVGWMVLPAFQGRGIASDALGLLVAQARQDPGRGVGNEIGHMAPETFAAPWEPGRPSPLPSHVVAS